MAHTYSHLYGFKTTGLRFLQFMTMGKADMAYYLFVDAINNQPIKKFNMEKWNVISLTLTILLVVFPSNERILIQEKIIRFIILKQ